MATTNLIEKTLGGILLSTGNGSPDHTAPKGSVYTDQDTGDDYVNVIGTNTWASLITSAYAEFVRSAQTTLSPATTGYTEITSNLGIRNSEGFGLTSSDIGGTASINFVQTQAPSPTQPVIQTYEFINVEIGDAFQYSGAGGSMEYIFTSTDPSVYIPEMVTQYNNEPSITLATASNTDPLLTITGINDNDNWFGSYQIVEASVDKLTVSTGFGGSYLIMLTTTLQWVATDTSYNQGILINGSDPIVGSIQSTSMSTNRRTGNITSYITADLAEGDIVSIGLQAGSAGDVIVKYQSMIMWKKGN